MNDMKIIIPHYGSQELLDDCVKSIYTHIHDRITIETINGNDERLFFTESVNRSLRKKNGVSRDTLIINNDVLLSDGFYDNLIKAVRDYPDVGVFGVQQRLPYNRDVIWYGGSVDCFPNGQHKQGLVSLGQLQENTYERWINFACVFIRKEVYRDIGILDGNLKHIFSDSDFCLRARYVGWRCLYAAKAIVIHGQGSSANPQSERLQRVMREDQIYFANKWIGSKVYHNLMLEVMQ